MLQIIAKIMNFKPDLMDKLEWYGVLIPVALFAVWYFLAASDPKRRSNVPWAKSKFGDRFLYDDGGIIIPYIVALVAWPIMAALANLSKIPAGWRVVIAIALMAMVANEVFRNVNKGREYIPVILVMVVDWLALSAATFDACAGGRETIAEKGWPNFWQLALGNVPFIVALLAIGCIIANVFYVKKAKRWWLPKLIAAILAIIWLIILAFWLGSLKDDGNKGGDGGNGDTSTPSVTVALTETPTPTQAVDNGITDKDREEIKRIMTAGEGQLDIILRQYGMYIGMKVCRNSFPEKLITKERLFEDGVSVPFRNDDPQKMVVELQEEYPNPVWVRAMAGYYVTVPQLEEFTWHREYIALYDTYGIEYFLEDDGETLTTQYLTYAAVMAYLHSQVEAKVIEIPGTVTVWRQAKGNILSYETLEDGKEHVVLDLGIARKDNYNELPEYRKVLVIHHGNKDAGYDEFINVFDKAPVIPKEEPKPSPTPSPKPTATPSPKPTATPSPKPTATPSPKPTATPSPKPTSTPKPTATPSPKPTATPTPTLTPTPTPSNTPIPKDPGQSSTGGSEQNKPSPTGEIFTGETATPTPKPNQATATPTQKPTATPTPMKSSKEEPNNSTTEDLDTSTETFREANNEPHVHATPIPTKVVDCETGKEKVETGKVFDNLDYDEQVNNRPANSTPTPTTKPAQTEDGNTISETPSGSWGRSGR